jgi:hypothetical protein
MIKEGTIQDFPFPSKEIVFKALKGNDPNHFERSLTK